MLVFDFDVFRCKRNIRIDMVEMAILFIFGILCNGIGTIRKRNRKHIVSRSIGYIKFDVFIPCYRRCPFPLSFCIWLGMLSVYRPFVAASPPPLCLKKSKKISLLLILNQMSSFPSQMLNSRSESSKSMKNIGEEWRERFSGFATGKFIRICDHVNFQLIYA